MSSSGTLVNRGFQFEDLVRRVLERHELEVMSEVMYAGPGKSRRAVDLVAISNAGAKTVIEVKLYRTRAPNPIDVARTVDVLLEAQAALKADHAMLATSIPRDQIPDLGEALRGVVLLPFDDLLELAKGDVVLLQELTNLDRELNSSLRDFDRPVPRASGSPNESPRPTSSEGLPPTLMMIAHHGTGAPPSPGRPASHKGYDLAQELIELPMGAGKRITLKSPPHRTGVPWSLFEQICQEALEYVFEGQMDNWTKQQAVGGENNRLDALAKVTGEDVFCRTLIEDFDTRYVLFEFKNYRSPVPANLVHITEKYLYPKALRATAVIISPKGLAPAARTAGQGALRDTGKLVLDLTVADLRSMLLAKDAGTPGTVHMEKLLDDYLLKLDR